MRIVKIVSVAVVLAGVAILAVVAAPSVYGHAYDAIGLTAADEVDQDRGRPDERRAPDQRAPDQRARELTILAGRGAEIGVSISDVNVAEADRQKIQGGVLIEEVRPDGAADKAGLKRSDIIVEFDGEHVRSARQFGRLVQETAPGRTVKATIVRDGKRSDVQLTPAEGRSGLRVWMQPEFDRALRELDRLPERLPPFNFNFDFGMQGFGTRGRLGISVEELTPQLSTYFGVRDGVLVASVVEDSAASRAGIKAGDVITTINNERIESREDLTRALRDAADEEVTIALVRDKKEMTVRVKMEARPRALRPGRPV